MPVLVRALGPVMLMFAAAHSPAQAERPPEAFQVALGLLQRGLHDEAARHFATFLASSPDHALAAEAHYRLGSCRAELGQPDAAIAELQKALRRPAAGFRLRPECRYRLGNLLQGKGEHERAVEQFDALAEEAGKDHYLLAPAHFAAGECRRELGDDARAARSFAAAAEAAAGEQASYRFPALYQLGFALLRQQHLADAAAVFAAAGEAAPDDAARGECRWLHGDALLRLQRHDEAAAAFAAAGEVVSEFADDAALGLGFVALGRGDDPAAVRAFEQVLARHGDSPSAAKARLELGRLGHRRQDHAAALAMLQPLLAEHVDPGLRRQARELAGLCELASGAGERAVASLRQALAEAGPADRGRLSLALGEAYANLQRWDDALAAYAAVPADAAPELRGDALYGACFALHRLARHQDSIARAEQVVALQPPHRLAAEAAFAIAENLFALQRWEPAEQAYAALSAAGPLAAKAGWKRAWCRYLRGDRAEAAQRFEAIARSDGSPFAEEALAMQALSLLEAGQDAAALQAADRYRARYREGGFLARTERIAARVLRSNGDLGAAQQRLANALAAAGAGADTAADRLEQAEIGWQQGDYRAADAAFAPLAERADAVGARALAGRAWCAFELGDDAACARWLAAAQRHGAAQEQLPGLFELQSAMHHRRQEWPAAIAAAQQFLQRFARHPKAPALRYALGVAQARSGEGAAARATLQALAGDGGYERMDRVHYELAWVCRRAGDEPAALAAFAEVAARSPDVELVGEAKLHLGVALLAQQDFEAAGAQLRAVQGSHRGQALYRLGFAWFQAAAADAGKLAVARDLFAAITAIPGEALVPEALFLGGECCLRLGDARGAAERLARLLNDAPQHERADRARLALGEAAVALDDAATAVSALEQFLRGGERDKADAARANLLLGRARGLRGEHREAEQCLLRVTELSDGPLAAEAQFRIGECRQARGDLPGAADAFVKLPILYAHAEWVRKGLLHAGFVYVQMKQPAKAKRFFTELQKQHAGSDEARAAERHLRDG